MSLLSVSQNLFRVISAQKRTQHHEMLIYFSIESIYRVIWLQNETIKDENI